MVNSSPVGVVSYTIIRVRVTVGVGVYNYSRAWPVIIVSYFNNSWAVNIYRAVLYNSNPWAAYIIYL